MLTSPGEKCRPSSVVPRIDVGGIVACRIACRATAIPKAPKDRATHVGREFAPAQLLVHLVIGADQEGLYESAVLLENRDSVGRNPRCIGKNGVGRELAQTIRQWLLDHRRAINRLDLVPLHREKAIDRELRLDAGQLGQRVGEPR